jgi:ParB family chromosome partitioning protein
MNTIEFEADGSVKTSAPYDIPFEFYAAIGHIMTATRTINDLATLTRGLERADDVFHAPCDRIEVSPYQAREFFDPEKLEELAEDIVEKGGVLHPILLRPHPTREGWFQLVAGERRWRATMMRFGKTIRATVRDWNDIQAAEIGLQENLKDESLTDFEEAKGTRALWEMYAKQGAEYNDTQFARLMKKSVTFITNCWKLLKLDAELLEIAKGRRGVKTSLIAINKVQDSTRRAKYSEMVKRGDSWEKVDNAIKEDNLKAANAVAASKAPDSQTDARQKAHAQGNSSSMSRGRMVTTPKGPSRQEKRLNVLRLQNEFIAATKDLNNEDYEELAVAFCRRFVRGDLAR